MGKHSLWASVICLTVCFFNGCEKKATWIRYIVPDGYRGVFVVQVECKDGSDVPIEDGFNMLYLPATGELRIKGNAGLYDWHKRSGRYTSGKWLFHAGPEHPNPPGDSIWFLYNTKHKHYHLVGTKKEYAEAVKLSPRLIKLGKIEPEAVEDE